MKAMLHQPKAFWLVFSLEVWERYGFYVVQSLIVTYLIQHFNLSDANSDVLFGSFAALAYLLTSLGGMVGDRLLGTKRTILIGAFTLALGYFIFSLPNLPLGGVTFALTMVALGNGLFKPNPSSLLSKVYETGNYNQDSGFTLYYMAINVGMVSSSIISPIIAVQYGWSWAFRLAFICLVIAIASYTKMRSSIKNIGSKPDMYPLRKDLALHVGVSTLILLFIAWWLMGHDRIMMMVLTLGTLCFLGYYVAQIFLAKADEQKGMVLFLVLFAVGCFYWALYFQGPTSLTLFALRNVNHHFLSFEFQGQQYQGLVGFWIIVMGPVMAYIYQYFKKKKWQVTISAKFALGMMFLALTFFTIPFSGLFNSTGIISSWWMVLLYWLQSISELLISALGFSMVSRYIPQRLMGFVMGLWLLTISMGSLFSGYIAAIASIPSAMTNNPLQSFPIYSHLFSELGWFSLATALVLFSCLPLLNRLSRVQNHD